MVGWDDKGVYRIKRGASLLAQSSDASSSAGNEFVQFKYNFQPESVDKSRPGGLVGNGETFELEFSGHGGNSGSTDQNHASASSSSINGGGAETYSWTSTEQTRRPVDCILIFDEETQTFTLERQHSAFSFIQNRRNKDAPKQPILLLPNSSYDPNAPPPATISATSTPVLPRKESNGRVDHHLSDSGSHNRNSLSTSFDKKSTADRNKSNGAPIHRDPDAMDVDDVDVPDGNSDIDKALEEAFVDIGEEADDDDDFDEDEEMEEVLTPVIPVLPPAPEVIRSPAPLPLSTPSKGPATGTPAKSKPRPRVPLPPPPEVREANARAGLVPGSVPPFGATTPSLPTRQRKVSTSGSESGSGSSSSGRSSSGSSSGSSSSGSGSDSGSGSGSSDSDSGPDRSRRGPHAGKRLSVPGQQHATSSNAPGSIGLGLSTPIGGGNSIGYGGSRTPQGAGSSTPKPASAPKIKPSTGGTPKLPIPMPPPPHERLKQQQQKAPPPRQKKESEILSDDDDDLVNFLDSTLEEKSPGPSVHEPQVKRPISLNAFTETVAGGGPSHEDEGGITSSDED
ncbi:hypothetical protein BG006_009554 [Podila minutissima]|uniref:Transcription elongation factor Eaf N-terminal domain-containing protein n=1 Tax=Podila minutissima TaxID=64525 RepID=A0A9P5VPY7_9FUNG|nr:hypothetical protein BG006_009554 [Podila minutissima]